ncbi:MAG: peptidylprolyl isomerase, partial [Phycisphaerae bacterium]|nr:peptidylprolyl isomerase [Phycisphaerae bacterium]
YGEKVEIRHIQCSSQEAINRAAALLKNKPFEQVAREVSENAITREQGGLMPPFVANDGAVPPLIGKQAFAMSVGQTSEPIREGSWYHIIRIEKRYPASGVGFENADQAGLRKTLLDRLSRQHAEEIETRLLKEAKVEIRDPKLERQYQSRRVLGGSGN